MKKRILAIILILTTLLTSFTFAEAKTSAEQRIEDLEDLFPVGSYFSVDGKACSHSSGKVCNNCELNHILNRNDLKQYKFSTGDCWTCFGFAKFAWYFIHGKNWLWKDDLIVTGPINYDTFKQAVPGDMVFFYDKNDKRKHAAIFTGSATDTYASFYHSNSGGTNRVNHNNWKYTDANKGYGSGCYVKIYRIKGYNDSYVQQSSNQKYYTIESAISTNHVVDIDNGSKEISANVQLWSRNDSSAQSFTLKKNGNYYGIINTNSGLALDIHDGSSKSGANVKQYTPKGNNAQNWKLQYTENGYFNIVSQLGTYLDVYGSKVADGTNIQAFNDNGGSDNQKFRFVASSPDVPDGTYIFESALKRNKVIDISGSSTEDGGKVHLWDVHGGDNQRFAITKHGDYYSIVCVSSGKSLDIFEQSTKSGAKVHQWTVHSGDSQKWHFEYAGNGYYYIKSALGHYLDVDDADTSNGTQIQVYKKNNTNAQKWKLVAVDGFGTQTYTAPTPAPAPCTHPYTITESDSAHPHAEYKECTSCGNISYTGNTKKVDSCTTCFPTHVHSYSTSISEEHPHREHQICECGTTIYLGNTTKSDCETCNPPKKLPDLPDKPVVTLDTPRNTTPDEAIDFHWNSPKNADYFEVRITNTDTDENCYNDWTVESNDYSLFLDEGNYAITVVSINKALVAEKVTYWNASEPIYVSVSKSSECVLTYNANGGIEPPSPVTVQPGTSISISSEEPQKDGYKFMGWSENLNGKVKYQAGYNITINENTTLYAVWKKDSTNISLTIGDTKATVSGQTKYNDVPPVIRNGRTMLPARFVAENLGATVTWDGNARKVVIKNSSTTIEIYIDSTTAYVNGISNTLDSAAFIENGRTYTPVRFICESLGANVDWNDSTKTVTITK